MRSVFYAFVWIILMAHRRLSVIATVPIFVGVSFLVAGAIHVIDIYVQEPSVLLSAVALVAVVWIPFAILLYVVCIGLIFDDALTLSGAYRSRGLPSRLWLKRLSEDYLKREPKNG